MSTQPEPAHQGRTATQWVEHLSDHAAHLVREVNGGRRVTLRQFMAAHLRTFDQLLSRFMTRLDAADPALAMRFREAFVGEYRAKAQAAAAELRAEARTA